ncbi:MAG: hypothetical protein WAQ52_20015 [Terriglobales bacterium]
MKTTLFALFLLSTTAALGQSVGSFINSEPVLVQVPSHQLHASQRPLAEEQSILFTSTNAYARGERPLWEVGAKPPAEIPLGDVARAFRSQHATVKKAVKVLEK